MQPWAALIIGFTAGGVYVFASWLILHVLKIDDPLDAGAVHAFCGAWGLIMAAAFAHAPNVRAVYGDAVADGGHGAHRYACHTALIAVCCADLRICAVLADALAFRGAWGLIVLVALRCAQLRICVVLAGVPALCNEWGSIMAV